ncbi:MAG TPA: SAM-dependent chlorinase/fluorinase [Chloroflexia bacterium]|nr:SAM-dependent chlorinase/fluorinase [Chloroflexia bacterium]
MNVYKSLLAGLEDRLERMERPPVITMTTDFGLHDGYVGTMKGVIHTLLPDAAVVDISHAVGPQQIHEAAFILYRAYRYFPASAIHIAVVDPGVGTSRRPIVLVTRHGTFVGPDNGIFTYVLRAERASVRDPEMAGRPAWVGGMWGVAPNWAGDEPSRGEDGDEEDAYGLPRAYHLINPDYWLASVSSTFHGRDIFAPSAAHLASGAQPERMGELVSADGLIMLPTGAPRIHRSSRGTTIVGQIVYMDHFGNIITNLPERLLAPLLEDAARTPIVEIGDHKIRGLHHSYGDVGEGQPLALIGSERLLEIAVRNANAAQRMKVRIGDPVRIVVGS